MLKDDYLEMIENATMEDCERIAWENSEIGKEKELAEELYGFVLGDNQSELAYEMFKADIDNKELERFIP